MTIPEITARRMIAEGIPNFWVCSKNQCTLETSEEDQGFDEAALMLNNVRVAVGGVFKREPAKGHCGQV